MSDSRANVIVMLSSFQFEITADGFDADQDIGDPDELVASTSCKAQTVIPDGAFGPPADRPPSAPEPQPAPDPDAIPFRVSDGTAQFSGDCAACRPYCGALCCKNYTLVHLSEQEAASGRYVYSERSDDCTCANCLLMRDLNLRYNLLKKEDGTCYYLDDANYCSIHADRPLACRMYNCANVTFQIKP